MTLAELAPGQTGRIRCLDAEAALRRRLIDLGLIPGAVIACVGESPLGDPRAYCFRGAMIALRRRDQAAVQLEFAPQGGDPPWA